MYDPSVRFTPKEALEHRYFRKVRDEIKEAVQVELVTKDKGS